MVSLGRAAAHWGHMGLGSLILFVNAALIWGYTLSCHSCRHIIGGRLQHFSKRPIRYKLLDVGVQAQREPHAVGLVFAVWLALTDFYVRCLATKTFHDPRFF